MNDKKTTFEELKKIVRDFKEERGWDDTDIKNNAISLVLESVEMLELFQWRSGKNVENDENLREELADEMSDVLWWILATADKLGIDVVKSFVNKHKKRGEKYPLGKFSKDLSREERGKNYHEVKDASRGLVSDKKD